MGVRRRFKSQARARYIVSMNKRPMFFDTFLVDVATGETTLHCVETESCSAATSFDADGVTVLHRARPTTATTGVLRGRPETGEARLSTRCERPRATRWARRPSRSRPTARRLLLGCYRDGPTTSRWCASTRRRASRPSSPRCRATASAPARSSPQRSRRRCSTSKKTGELIGGALRRRPARSSRSSTRDFADGLRRAGRALATACSRRCRRTRAAGCWIASFMPRPRARAHLPLRPRDRREPAAVPSVPAARPRRHGADDARSRSRRATACRCTASSRCPSASSRRTCPLVLNVHGGPWFHDIWGFDREVQFFANRGYAVLQVNFRGSSGYGKRHITARDQRARRHDARRPHRRRRLGRRAGHRRSRRGSRSTAAPTAATPTLVGVTFTPDYFAAPSTTSASRAWRTSCDAAAVRAQADEQQLDRLRRRPRRPRGPRRHGGAAHRSRGRPDQDAAADRAGRATTRGVEQAEADNIVAAPRPRRRRRVHPVPTTKATASRTPRTSIEMFKRVERSSPSTSAAAPLMM